MDSRKSWAISQRSAAVLITAALALSSLACVYDTVRDLLFKGYSSEDEQIWQDSLQNEESNESDVPTSPGDPGYSASDGAQGYAADESGSAPGADDSGSGVSAGQRKPVGFVNYGEFDAVVMPYTFIPLGKTDPVPPDPASTISSANMGVGEWPNTSRYLLLPLGSYSWCVDWEEGDVDEDGQIDYFHYIQNDPTVLDQDDSDELEFAEEVAISAPPSSGAVFEGRCEFPPVEDSCTGQPQQLRLYTAPGWVISSEYQPEVIAWANTGEYPPPEEGISITGSGGYGFQKAWILYQAGEFLEVTTSNPYTAMGVQPHGESYIGWARVLFDGVEVWRGDTASYYHDSDGYLHAVYIEVRCFPPGRHTLRIECLGKEGGGGAKGSGGRTDVPIAFFGFRK